MQSRRCSRYRRDVSLDRGGAVDILRRTRLFRDVSDPVLERIAYALRPLEVPAGHTVAQEGDAADRFAIVEAGSLVVSSVFSGRERELGRLLPGDFFGELGLLHRSPYGATVRAETDTRLLTLTAAEFTALLEQLPGLASAVREVAQDRKANRMAVALDVERYNIANLLEQHGQIRIGRSDENDLVFATPTVSRRHAVIALQDGKCRLTDLNSTSGTFVNGREVRGTVDLEDGDVIAIADNRFVFDRVRAAELVQGLGIRVDVVRVRKEVGKGKTLLHDVSFTVLPGELTAIVGASGAGKSVLLDAMSGVRPATGGEVRYDGRDYYAEMAEYRHTLGYVPQDDIIHREMPLRLTLRYAARLRLPRDTGPEELDAAVDRALEQLGLADRADVRVGMLSGGQRKRASIGIELLTAPRIFFLDEPTSGLDPSTDRHMMQLLRDLADDGKTVVLTTHATASIRLCDKIAVVARDGHLAFFGRPSDALHHFQVDEFDEIYDRVADELSPAEWSERFRATPAFAAVEAAQSAPRTEAEEERARISRRLRPRGPAQALHQFRALSRRNFDLYARFPVNVIPLVMQPVVITLLLLALFPANLFVGDSKNPTVPLQLVSTLCFVIFLFGLLFGVQEIVKERAIFRRERMVNVGVFPYLMSKLSFLAPLLLVCTCLIVAVLWLLDRLPDAGFLDTYVPLLVTLVLTAWAGLALALLISALVNSSQLASDLLTPWIAPQVLFAGALLAVPAMNSVGKLLADVTVVRWAFEGSAAVTDLKELFERSTSPIGKALELQYEESFLWQPYWYWVILAAFILVPLALALVVLTKKTQPR